MTQINIIGNILDSSGYSIHTRNLANALSKITDVKLTTTIPKGAETFLTDKEIEMLKKPDKGEINLIITSPIHWKLNLNAKRNWAFLVFEGDRIPKSFIEECLNPDIEYIFVPSEHTFRAVINTIEQIDSNGEKLLKAQIASKMRIIPHGVNLDLFYPKDKPEKFSFICNKGFRNLEDRGGIQYALQAYLEEFTNKDKVNMIIKINPAYGIPNINLLIEEIKPKDKTDFAPVQLNIDNIPYDKLVELYNKAHVLVAPSRSDAFNIPGIEAMACGLPVISTTFGGQTDYIKENNNGWLIDGKMTEVTWELLYEGVKWLTPDVSQLRKIMRLAYDNQDLVKNMGNNALETAKTFTWDNSASKVKELI